MATDRNAETTKTGGTCPECGVDMAGRDGRGHSIKHYGDRRVDANTSPEAAKRQGELLALGKRQADEQVREDAAKADAPAGKDR